MKMEMCITTQNNLTEEMTVRNNTKGTLSKRHADKSARNVTLTNNLKHMGQRSMSNTFARAYYKRIARAFEQWKEAKRGDKYKEMIIRRTLDHMMKATGKYLFAVMTNWKNMAKINE